MIQATLYVILDIDECTLGEDNCHENAICSDTVGGSDSFQCVCTTGYIGDGIMCVGKLTISSNLGLHAFLTTMHEVVFLSTFIDTDENECITSFSEVCIEAVACVNTDGSYMCICTHGLTWNGTACEGTHHDIVTLVYEILHESNTTSSITKYVLHVVSHQVTMPKYKVQIVSTSQRLCKLYTQP